MDQITAAALARWRRTEQVLEVGLDPELARRLDALRVEDARLMRRPAIRPVEPVARARDPILKRAG